jgi:hypothetical protein
MAAMRLIIDTVGVLEDSTEQISGQGKGTE